MNWENLILELSTTLLPIIGIIFAYVLITIARFIAKTTNNELVKVALENLEKIILATVSALSQTIVDDLKKGRRNGKLTTEEAQMIKENAFASIYKQLSTQELEILKSKFGSVEELIDNMIEKNVQDNKLKKGDF